MLGMRIVVLAGGIGGARFLQGVRAHARALDAEVTAIVNVGDDVWMHGLRICPDLDSVMYTLGGGIDPERRWGRAHETWTVKEELAKYGAEPIWFGLGDRDIATHLIRTRMLNAGYPLSAVTQALCDRWQPGITLLPASDDRVETHAIVADPADSDGDTGSAEAKTRAIHFQEWWVRHRGELPTSRFVFVGAQDAKPAAGVLDALTPIIGGAPVRGMADKCLAALDVECSAAGVGRLYGPRAEGGLLDGWLVDTVDAQARVPGTQVLAVPLWMTDDDATAAMVRAALDLAGASA
jgi:LPPG:FO 2-phospho-L-lactate transferase